MFSSTIQTISTDAAKFRDLTWLARIGRQRTKATVASVGSRMADTDLEEDRGLVVSDMCAAISACLRYDLRTSLTWDWSSSIPPVGGNGMICREHRRCTR